MNCIAKTLLKEELVEWLLTGGESWVVYRTLIGLLDKEEKDNIVVTTKMAIPKHQLIRKIFESLNMPSKGFENQRWSICFSRNETTEEGLHLNQYIKCGPVLTLNRMRNLRGGSPFWLCE